MKKSLFPLEKINDIGFSFIYLLSTYLGSILVFVSLLELSALLSNLPLSVYPVRQDPPGFPQALPISTPSEILFSGIGLLLLLPIVIIGGSFLMKKIRSTKLFAILTFIILLFTYPQVFPGFFSQHHHLNNPAFYVLVGAYLISITAVLTYLWKKLIVEYGKTTLPWKTYSISALVFIPEFYFLLSGIIDGTYVPWGSYLFDHFLINIFFLDASGYFGIWIIIGMLTTLTIVSKILGGNFISTKPNQQTV